ncbi:O-antigen ligase family protein [Aquimarina sp. Aq107]|uniref:O-antigen ligase family protein n=1 Tax=Aquimarina sp. Aq107 TaxID=1191912 RepID=UPI000D553B5C|nr:O-antigen ligase family protein [Aquimarina sp. Aq107]
MRISLKKYNQILLIISFLVLLLSKALAGTVYSRILSIGLILIFGLSVIALLKIRIKHTITNYLFLVYLLLFVSSLVKQFFLTDLSLPGLINVFLFFLIVVFVQCVAIQRIRPSLWDMVKLLYYILFSYVFLNIFLFILGFEQDRYMGTNALLGLLNINLDRASFIFAPSLAYFAMICGVCGLISLILFFENKKFQFLIGFVISVTALLLTDSRGPIFGLVIIFLFLFPLRRLWIKYQLALFLFYIFSVTLFVSVMFFINMYIFDLESLSRGGDTSLLSKRDLIWNLFFENYDPSFFNLVFGYGNVGQYISGISSKYKFLFVNWSNPDHISLHNNSLQMLIDIGVLGIISFNFVLYKVNKFCIDEYKKNKETYLLIIPAIINYLLILGFSDIIANISNVGVYFILIFLIIGVISQSNHK